MQTHTQTTQAQTEFSPEWLYDSLMEQIEPELMSATIETLEKKYANETEKEKEARALRYEEAFKLYDECLAELDWVIAEDAKFIKKEMEAVVRSMEADERKADEQTAESLLDSFNKNA